MGSDMSSDVDSDTDARFLWTSDMDSDMDLDKVMTSDTDTTSDTVMSANLGHGHDFGHACPLISNGDIVMLVTILGSW